MISMNKKTDKYRSSGFTLVEIIVVVVIISIAAVIAVPMLSSAADMQIRSAANIIAADMEYAKSMAISRQKSYSVIFDVNNESYEIQDSDGNVISHPVNASGNFIVSFASDSRLDRVDISAVDFNSDLTVIFDYLGSPFDVSNQPLNSGQVTLEADGITVNVNVEPVTGYVTVE